MDEQRCLQGLKVAAGDMIEKAWEEQRRQALLWHACREAVAAGDRVRLAAWHRALDEARTVITRTPAFGKQHDDAALAYLACAALSLDALQLPGPSTPGVEVLIPLLHAAAKIVKIPCDCDVDHGQLYTALETQQSVGTTAVPPGSQGVPDSARRALYAVDMVFNILAGKTSLPAPPVTRAWAWDVTRAFLGTKRSVISACQVTVAGIDDKGVLAALLLEVLEPGSGEVFHAPEDVFLTCANADFLTSMQKAWDGAWPSAPTQEGTKRIWNGRWRLLQGKEPGSQPVEVANGGSASGAAARGWWHALRQQVPDDRVIVIAQVDTVDNEGVLWLKGVDDAGVFVKTQAIAQDRQFDTIVVASEDNKEAALKALGEATHICVRNLAAT